jgi:hypothetical protein
MNKKLVIGIAASAVVLILITTIVINADKLVGKDDEIVIIDFDYEMAGNHVNQLIQWGPRMSGSQAEEYGADYIAEQFEEAGLEDVHIERFPVPMFEVLRASVSLSPYMRPNYNLPNPVGRSISFTHIEDFVLQGYSGSIRWNNFRDDLEVVNIGDGTDVGSYGQTNGRVCFVEQTGETPPNAELYFYAYEAGARGIILQNTWRGETIGYPPMFKSNQNPEHYENYPDIPFFMVSKDMGDQILTNIPEYKLRINFEVRIDTMDVLAVVGDIKASGDTDDLLMFTAHHDTCYNTIGVVDNTVGPATLIEMARSLSEYDVKKNLRFATFGGEEEGLYGCREYYEAHKEEMDSNLEAVMNFDMAHTDKEAMSLAMVSNSNDTLDKLEKIGTQLMNEENDLKKYKISYHWNELDIGYSDYWPFVNEGGSDGIASWGSGCEEYHTYLDNMDHLNEESLQVEARIVGSFALMAAT